MDPELQKMLNQYRSHRMDLETWIEFKCEKFNTYLRENNLSSAIVSVSGGIDSAVTLGLLTRTLNMPNSYLKKVYAISQPIHSSDWALERAKELCETYNVELVTIDQSDVHDSIVSKVEKETGMKGNVYSKGQLKSYMRTPINYYLAQLISQNGYPTIVMGTGNMDEDGYLAYFCKYGDGGVDVQLISDLHKSEVFKVGKILKVPDSILNAKPSADLWDGQNDEEELGFSYDFIELYTGVYLKHPERFDHLENSVKYEFLRNVEKCRNIHLRNLHKLKGVINI